MIGRAKTGARSVSWASFIYASIHASLAIVVPATLLPVMSAAAEEQAVITVAAPVLSVPGQTLRSSVSGPATTATSTPATASQKVLDGRMVACQAACCWTPAQALRARGRTVLDAYQREDARAQQAAQTIATFLNLQACHQEDLAAASGIKAYYTRIAIAEQLRLGAEARKLLAEEETQLQAVRRSGLLINTDLSDFQRRGLEIDDQELQLRAQDQQLRSALVHLAHCDYDMEDVLQEELLIQPIPLNCEALISQALRERYDLRSWSYLASQVTETSAPHFAQLLSTSVGAFGLPLPPAGVLKHLLMRPDHATLASNLQRELRLMLETLCGTIRQSVEEKCAKLELAYGRLDLAQQTVASWQTRRGQLQQLEQFGKPDLEQTARAQAGWMRARAEEIKRRLEARLAEVELAEATGRLAQRCCAGQAWLVSGQPPTSDQTSAD